MNRMVCIALTLGGLLGAQTPSTNTGSTGGSNSGPGTTGVTIRNLPTQGSNTTPSTTAPSDSRPIYLSGRVMMEDGSPLPQTVNIQRICYGSARNVAATSASGTFSFQWGSSEGLAPDAADAGSRTTLSGASGSGGGAAANGGFNPRSTAGCELRANVTGFRSDIINLNNRTSLDSPDLGVIVLHRLVNTDDRSVSASSLSAPKAARNAYQQGLQALAKRKPEDAAKDFEKAVALYPGYADAWLSLGKLRRQQGKADAAQNALLKSAQADPKLIGPLLELGFMAAKDNHWDVAASYLERAVKLESSAYPIAWYTLAVANFNLNQYEDAERNVRRAAKLDPNHSIPREQYLLGLLLQEKKDFEGAAAELNAYVKLAPSEPDTPEVKDRIRQIEKMLGDGRQAAK